MPTFSKIILSGSTDGEGIAVTATTASQGTTIHTAVTGAAESIDEIYIYAYSAVTTIATLSLAIGPTTATGSRLSYTVTADDLSGLHLVYPGIPLRNAKVVKAYATTADVFNLFGFANRSVT
tara:strand:+ start:3832 stop:4197 length:366 start_codon:yes stop_codon:yes gene_type:complete